MNELIKVDTATIGGKQVQSVDARELHGVLQVGRAFGAWITSRIDEYDFVQGRDFEVFSESGNNPQGGRPMKTYIVTIDMAKELAMVERTDIGKQARQYFIDCERRALAQQPDPIKALNDPTTMRGLLLNYAEKVLELEQQNAKLEHVVAEQVVPVRVFHTIAVSDDTYCLRDAAKILQQRPTDLMSWLSTNKWIYRRVGKKSWLAYQDKIQRGVLVHKVSAIQREEGAEKIVEQVRVTGKGLTVLGEVFHVQLNDTLKLETGK